MCRKPTRFWCTLAVVFSVVVLGAGPGAHAQQASGDVEAGDNANPDNVPPRRRGVVTEEADAPEAQVKPLPRQGASRRPDTLELPRRVAQSPAGAAQSDGCIPRL